VPQDGSELSLTNLKGSLVNLPPIVGTMTLGLMIHPWEDREKQHRLTFDLRFEGQYRSQGRDYSELFDALGSSSAASIRNPNYGAFTGNPNYSAADCNDGNPNTPCLPRSVIDPSTGSAYFTGLTNVAAHGGARGSASVTWQPSEYVKLNLGMGVGFVQGHGLTVDAPCNPNFGDATVEESGFCQAGDLGSQNVVSTGIPNPNYRPPINSVGRRFFVDDATTFDVFASGTVMF